MKRYRLGATWIEPEELAYSSPTGAPSTSARRGFVRFPDGKLRKVRLGVADTFFTIPAKPMRGRVGFIAVEAKEYRFFGGFGSAERRIGTPVEP